MCLHPLQNTLTTLDQPYVAYVTNDPNDGDSNFLIGTKENPFKSLLDCILLLGRGHYMIYLK